MNKQLIWLMAAAFSSTAWAQGMSQAPTYPASEAAPAPAQQQYPDLPLNADPSTSPEHAPSYSGARSSGGSMDATPSSGNMSQRGMDNRGGDGHGRDGHGMQGQHRMGHGQGASGHPGQGMDSNNQGAAHGMHDSNAMRSGTPAPMSSLKPVTENGFTYLCGGIGSDESAQMKQSAREYDLMLTFASRKGSYLADVEVDISGKGDARLQATCDAPIMLVDFPKGGSYRIKATTNGKTLTRNTSIKTGKGHKALVMVWPDASAPAGKR